MERAHNVPAQAPVQSDCGCSKWPACQSAYAEPCTIMRTDLELSIEGQEPMQVRVDLKPRAPRPGTLIQARKWHNCPGVCGGTPNQAVAITRRV